MAKKKTILDHSSAARDAITGKRPQRPASPLDERTRDLVLELLREGATLAEICIARKVTSYTRLYQTRVADPAFDAEVRKASAMGAETAIAEAQEFGKQAAAEGNPDMMRVAESFGRLSTTYAEKIAPKEFGQLVKLGDHNGGALQIVVANFAPLNGGALSSDDIGKAEHLAVGSRARLNNQSEEELDPL